MPAQLFDQLHSDWKRVLQPHKELIDHIQFVIQDSDVTPDFDNIFRSLARSIASTKVIIIGQDPYPTKGHAHGLAFSVANSVNPLPPSLRNIFIELAADCGITRTEGDLSDWFDQGVMLLNRVLTTETGSSLKHSELGWQQITNSVAQELGKRDVVAILWGRNAGELAQYFRPEECIVSAHPSPLSSYRGFFGSKPFSRTNLILQSKGIQPINWKR